MDEVQPIVTELPLESLPAPYEGARRVRWLDAQEIAQLLRHGDVCFLIADVGKPLELIPLENRFNFWRTEAKVRIADPGCFVLENFPSSLAFVASEWRDKNARCIVLLEAHH